MKVSVKMANSVITAFLALPPHNLDAVGRHTSWEHPVHPQISNLIRIYNQQRKKPLCNKTKQKVSDNLYVSLFSGMSLYDYVTTRSIEGVSGKTG